MERFQFALEQYQIIQTAWVIEMEEHEAANVKT